MSKIQKYFLNPVKILVLVPVLWLAGCGTNEPQEHEHEHAAEQTYTCPMHPQIVQDKPGVCPVCSMDLVPFDKSTQGDALLINETRQALANITVVELGNGSLSSTKMLNGRLMGNPQQTHYISSHVGGRIEQLYVRELGVAVRKGQPLYKIYSEELAVLQREYLLAIEQAQEFTQDAKFAQIAGAAKQKLLLYRQTDAQIQTLSQQKHIDANVTFYAPEAGIVAELSITQGQYVEQGSPILRLENYKTLWVEADVYPHEAGNVYVGQEVKVVIPGWENTPEVMEIQFVTPSLQAGSQLLQIRGTLANPTGQWQVGQQATIHLPMKSEADVLKLPVDAVIRTGAGTHVWIETEKDTFESRRVETGIENFDQVEIIAGLTKGDRVVITGAYLLNSEYILKKGSDPMAAHQH